MEYASLRNDAIYVYKRKNGGSGTMSVKQASKDNLRLKYTCGGLSQTAKKEIRKNVDNWQWAVTASQKLYSKGREKRRRYFVLVTLTLPSKQIESDNVIKRKYLNVWLQNLERVHKGINWLWVAESQKNGNIHFHVVVDRWVNFAWVQKSWNRVLSNGYYIDAFEEKYGHRSPSSTDVCGQKRMGNPAGYITKYLTGDKFVRDIEGRKWGMCDNLRKIEDFAIPNILGVEQIVLEHFAKDLKNVAYGEFSTAYYFDKPLLKNGVWDRLLWQLNNAICNRLKGFYQELGNCLVEDLPIEPDDAPAW